MGRKKVDPSKRQRALHACQPCHASKKRCDCKLPCSNCIKRNDASSCVYSSAQPRVPGITQTGRIRPTDGNRSSEDTTACPTAHSRMLWSSRGTQVYVGDAASLSFLHLLRDILGRYMGPSDFTDDARKGFMLETARNSLDAQSLECHHTYKDSSDLIDYFLASTSGVLDIYPREILQNFLKSRQNGTMELLQHAVTNALIAIGAQTRSNGPEDVRCEVIHLAHAQRVAFENMLEEPGIDLIRLFLLLSFYMLGACRRNSAYIYIGVAARISCALGLHHEEAYRAIDEEERKSRQSTWKSVRILDLLIGSVLGRPVGTSIVTKPAKTKMVSDKTAEAHRTLSLEATFEVWSIADEAVHKFYNQKSADVSAAKSYLTRLEQWSSGLSNDLRNYARTGSHIRDQELVIGNTHVACSYYFTVMLVTRKFLITHLMRQLGDGADRERKNISPEAESSELAKLTKACTESAQLMLQTCHDLLNAGLLLKNMCLLKAWIFAAALILGFAMFVQEETQQQFDNAFSSATDVLQMLSQQSPQAQLYHEILSNFRRAIQQHHAERHGTSGYHRDSYVAKIFSLHDSSYILGVDASQNPSKPMNSPFDTSGNVVNDSSEIFDMTMPSEEMQFNNDIISSDFDSVAAQLWDDFIFNHEFLDNPSV